MTKKKNRDVTVRVGEGTLFVAGGKVNRQNPSGVTRVTLRSGRTGDQIDNVTEDGTIYVAEGDLDVEL